MTFDDWWKKYIDRPGCYDLRFNDQAEIAALDAWEAATLAELLALVRDDQEASN